MLVVVTDGFGWRVHGARRAMQDALRVCKAPCRRVSLARRASHMTKSLDAAVATSASRVAQGMRAALHLVSIVAPRSHMRRATRLVHFLPGRSSQIASESALTPPHRRAIAPQRRDEAGYKAGLTVLAALCVHCACIVWVLRVRW